MTKQFASENDFTGTARYIKFLSESIKFFQRCVTYLRKSMPVLKNDLIKSLTFIRLPDCQKATLNELSILVTRFPKCYSTGGYHSAWNWIFWVPMYIWERATIYLNEHKIPNRIDFTWNEIAKVNDPCTGQPKFKHLPKLEKFLLLIPHLNVYCERSFSTV